ncbi:MAG: hypothetical protein JW395_4044 [Nitrospira sp.]|nr:hypothetical protein [Nitrospira sp.]
MNALSLGTGTGTAQTKTQALEPGQAPPLAEPVPPGWKNGDILLFLLGLRTGTGTGRELGQAPPLAEHRTGTGTGTAFGGASPLE